MTEWVRVADVAALAEGRPSTHVVASEQLLLLRQKGHLFACQAVCPHKFADLGEGTVGDGTLTCAQHDATFDLATGRAAPGCEWAGSLQVYPVRSREGAIEVQITSC